MAGGMRKLGVGALGFGLALVVGEARNPGTASQTVESTVNGAVPVVRGGGVLAGETLSAGTPVFEGARDAIGGFGLAAAQVAPTEDTLPTTPLAGE